MRQITVYPIQESSSDGDSVDAEYILRCAALPFWCYDDHLHERMPNYRENGCCFTHTVGLPRIPKTGEELPLTEYQIEFAEIVINNRRNYHEARKYHLNKGRQMGFTEIVLRVIQYLCLHEYAGYKVGIIAATNGDLAKKDLRRFERLFRYVQPLVKQWRTNNKMILNTGTEIEAFRASEEAITGDTFYKGIFMDEAAKWKNRDDKPLFNSIMPIINLNGADLYLVSTPKGPVKTFYEIHKKPRDFIKLVYDIWRTEGNLYTHDGILLVLNRPKGPVKTFYEIHKKPRDFIKLVYDIWRTEGNLYTHDEIQYMIDNATEDPNQEYLWESSRLARMPYLERLQTRIALTTQWSGT